MPTPPNKNQNDNKINSKVLKNKPNIPAEGLLSSKNEFQQKTIPLAPSLKKKSLENKQEENNTQKISPPQKFEKLKSPKIKLPPIPKIDWLKSLLYLIILIIIVITIFGYAIYYLELPANIIAKIIPYPSALIKTPCGYKIIKYSDFNEDLRTIIFFYKQKKSQDENFIIPESNQITSDVYDKELKNKLMECLAEKRGLEISKQKLTAELEKIILQAGDEEALSQTIKNLYNWNLETFQKKVLYPYLLEKNLTESINADSQINATSREKIENVLKLVLENPNNFYRIAREHSEDSETQHRGGDLNWVEKGQLDPKLEEFIFNGEKGDISEIIQTNAGYHILKITNKKTTRDEVDQVRVSHILIKTRELENWLEQELQKCEVYKLI